MWRHNEVLGIILDATNRCETAHKSLNSINKRAIHFENFTLGHYCLMGARTNILANF